MTISDDHLDVRNPDGRSHPRDAIISTPVPNLDLIPVNRTSPASVELTSATEREFRLRKALRPLAAEYDFIIIDCPPRSIC